MIAHDKAIRLDTMAMCAINCIENLETAIAFANIRTSEDFDILYESINNIRNDISDADETSC